MVGIPVSDDYDPQPDDDAYPLDPFFYLRAAAVAPLIRLAVDPAYCTMRLKTSAALDRLKKDLNKAHPYLVAHFARFMNGDMPADCANLLYYISRLTQQLDEDERNPDWRDWIIEEPEQCFLTSVWKIPELYELHVDDMTATAFLDHSNGLCTKAQIATLLAEAKAAQDEHWADGAGARKRAKVANKAPPAAPETPNKPVVPTKPIAKVTVSVPATPKDKEPKTTKVAKATASSSRLSPVTEPPPKPKARQASGSGRTTRSSASRTGKAKAKAATTAGSDEDEAEAVPTDDEGHDSGDEKPNTDGCIPDDLQNSAAVDPDGPEYQVVDNMLVSKYFLERKIIEYRTLLEEANKSKKPKRHSLELIQTTFQHGLLFKSYSPRNPYNVPDSWNPNPIPRIPFERVERAFSVALLEHPGFSCLGCVMRRKKCVYRGHRVDCYNCAAAHLSSCTYKLPELANEEIRHALIAFTNIGTNETQFLLDNLAAAQRRLLSLQDLARRATEDFRHDWHHFLEHIRRAVDVVGLKAVRKRFIDAPENLDILDLVDSHIKFLNDQLTPMAVHPDYKEEKDHGDSASDGSSSDSETSSESEADAPSTSKEGRAKAATVISLEEAKAENDEEEDEEMYFPDGEQEALRDMLASRVRGLECDQCIACTSAYCHPRAWGSPCDCCSLRMDYACSFMDYDAWVKYRDDTDKELYDGEYCATTEYPYKELYPLVPVFFCSELSTVFDYEHRLSSKVLNNLKDRAGLRFIRALWTAANYPEHTIALATARLVQLNSEG
ncbi:hypothetical protein C8J57DRAFT_1502204 [Mycena rebaudengoi]|nr:hypothetical protein C8J57DRAFT_1502204 [Mycena rebaudengoi]